MPDDYTPLSSFSKTEQSGKPTTEDFEVVVNRFISHDSPAIKEFEMRYRLEICAKFAKVDHLGFTIGQDERPLNLSEIYVQQRLRSVGDRNSIASSNQPEIGISDALGRYGHIVVLGGPGTGKSTLVHFLAYSFAHPAQTLISRKLGSRIPIPIILRKYDINSWEHPEEMLDSFISMELSRELQSEVTAQALLNAMETGSAILLLDGFDEITNRSHLQERLEFWLSKWPKLAVVITSRPTGYPNLNYCIQLSEDENRNYPWFRKVSTPFYKPGDSARVVGFVDVTTSSPHCMEVERFSKLDIFEFVRKWYSVRIVDTELRDKAIQSLVGALQSSEPIMRMAEIPSLLVLMALIHRNLAYLPSGRVELYDQISEAYLESLQRSRGMKPFGAKMDQMKRWLAHLAYNMLKAGTVIVHRDQILYWLKEAIAPDTIDVELLSTSFLTFLEQRAGLIVESGPSLYAWAHLSLQEHFAARHLRGMIRNFDSLAQLCLELTKEDRWHETIIQLFGMLGEFSGAADDLAAEMIKRCSKTNRDSLASFFILLLGNESYSYDSKQALSDHTSFISHHISSRNKSVVLEWILESACNGLGPRTSSRLRLLEESQKPQIQSWLRHRLNSCSPQEIGADFFAVAQSFYPHGEWNTLIPKWISERGSEKWLYRHVRDVILSTNWQETLGSWGPRNLTVKRWLKEDFFNVCLADIQLPMLLRHQYVSPYNTLLAELGAAMSVSRSMLTRHLIWLGREYSAEAIGGLDEIANRTWPILSNSPHKKYLASIDTWHIEDAFLDPDAPLVWYTDQIRPRDEILVRNISPWSFTNAVASTSRSYAVSLIRSRIYQTQKLSKLSLLSLFASHFWEQPTLELDSLATYVANSAQLLACADRQISFSKPQMDVSLLYDKLISFRERNVDDWTMLLTSAAILIVGRGTPEIVMEYNFLLDKAITSPLSFTMPSHFLIGFSEEEFNGFWPSLIRHIFFHVPRQPWLQPEWFSLANSVSRYYCSEPKSLWDDIMSNRL